MACPRKEILFLKNSKNHFQKNETAKNKLIRLFSTLIQQLGNSLYFDKNKTETSRITGES
jgi:hypothetical protein